MAEFGDVVGVRARGDGLVAAGIVEVPVLVELDVLAGDEHVVAGRDLHDAVVEGAHLVAAEGHGVIDAFLIPPRGNAGGEERFDFRGEVEGVVVPGVKERLDAEAVARGEEAAAVFVPEDEGELAAQMLKAVDAEFLIEVKGDFAVGFGGEAVAALLQLLADGLVAVELAVDDDVGAAVFAGHGLVAGGEVDDAEAGVAEADAMVR